MEKNAEQDKGQSINHEEKGMSIGREERKELKRQAQALSPIVRIGKSGITSNVITEVRKHLKSKKLIKIKFLGSLMEASDKRTLFDTLLQESGATLIEEKGFTLVLYLPKKQDFNSPKP